MSSLILKDLLGVDRAITLKGIQRSREKYNLRKKRKIERVYQAVDHFEKKMNRRRKRLKVNIEHSKKRTYNQTVHGWQTEYDAIMARKRRT